jgi:hypothetical protein
MSVVGTIDSMLSETDAMENSGRNSGGDIDENKNERGINKPKGPPKGCLSSISAAGGTRNGVNTGEEC